MQATDHTVVLNNELLIPEIGFGVFQIPDGEETYQAVRDALDAGYRHIDTAAAYNNEESVGKAIADSGIDRSDIFVTTKLWNDDIRKGRTLEAYQESLDRLGLDYVDMYLIHWPAQGWQTAWERMVELYEEGSMKAIGVCNFERHHLEELMEVSDKLPQVDQIESSPQFPNQDLIDFCHANNIAVEAWSPLGGTGGTLLHDDRLREIGDKYGKSPAQVVIRWHLQREVIVLPKSAHKARIEQNIHVFDFQLTDEEMNTISTIDTGKRNGADPDNFNF